MNRVTVFVHLTQLVFVHLTQDTHRGREHPEVHLQAAGPEGAPGTSAVRQGQVALGNTAAAGGGEGQNLCRQCQTLEEGLAPRCP